MAACFRASLPDAVLSAPILLLEALQQGQWPQRELLTDQVAVVARVIAFLISEDARYLVGETIQINGGQMMD